MCFIEETQREDVDVVVEYSNMKPETDLKSELAKPVSISMAKPKPGQANKYIFIVKKGNELI